MSASVQEVLRTPTSSSGAAGRLPIPLVTIASGGESSAAEPVLDALSGYLRGDSDLAAVRSAFRSAGPHRGWSPGELAELVCRARTPSPQAGLVVDTKSASTSKKSKTCAEVRYCLLRGVRLILPSKRYAEPGQRGYRTADCSRYVNRRAELVSLDSDHVVEILRRKDDPRARARIHGLQLCGSVWACPVCAARITENRRKEIRHAVAAHRAQGGEVYMLTLTFPHTRFDRLVSSKNRDRDRVGAMGSFDALRAALRKFNGGRAMAKYRQSLEFVGSITAKEVTYGVNGWHPHGHSLWFAAAGHDPETVQLELAKLWRAACVSVGLDVPSFEYGLKVSVVNVDDYVSKWGADSELTKWHLKRGRATADKGGLRGLTPWDLIAIALGSGPAQVRPGLCLTPGRAAALFREFVDATHGSAQLFWSAGLKVRYGVDVFSDRDLAERREVDDELLGGLVFDQWRIVDVVGKLPEFLGLVDSDGFPAGIAAIERWRVMIEARDRSELQWQMRSDSLRSAFVFGCVSGGFW